MAHIGTCAPTKRKGAIEQYWSEKEFKFSPRWFELTLTLGILFSRNYFFPHQIGKAQRLTQLSSSD